MEDAQVLLTTALDQGDRLLEALWAYDNAAAETLLSDRQTTLDRLLAAPRPPALPGELLARFSAQDARLQATLSEHLREARRASETAARAHTAQTRYLAGAHDPHTRLDTAPR
jgi:hypothetical protein